MSEQTRQQIAADLEYAMGQLRLAGGAKQCIEAMCMRDHTERALDALERVRGYLERAERCDGCGA